MEDEQINWNKAYNSNNINSLPTMPYREPKVDKVVSAIVGKDIVVTDKRLLNLVAKWKKESNPNEPNNFMENEKFIEELKETFK